MKSRYIKVGVNYIDKESILILSLLEDYVEIEFKDNQRTDIRISNDYVNIKKLKRDLKKSK